MIPGPGKFIIWPVAAVAVDCDPYWDNVVLAVHFDDVTEYHASGYIGDPWYTTKEDACSLGSDVAYAGSKYGRHNVGADTCEVFNDAGYTSLFTTWTYATRSSIVDEKGHTVTSVGDAHVSVSQAIFDGSGDYLTSPYSTDFNFPTNGDFCIEALFTIDGNSAGSGFATIAAHGLQSLGNTDYWWLGISGTAGTTGTGISFEILIGAVAKEVTAVTTVSHGVEHHVAVVRNSGVVELYLDGVQLTKATDTITTQAISGLASNPLFIGGTVSSALPGFLNGKVNEIRITKGLPRYTAGFTPPTAPFAEVAC